MGSEIKDGVFLFFQCWWEPIKREIQRLNKAMSNDIFLLQDERHQQKKLLNTERVGLEAIFKDEQS